jgi:hypothetical protein
VDLERGWFNTSTVEWGPVAVGLDEGPDFVGRWISLVLIAEDGGPFIFDR